LIKKRIVGTGVPIPKRRPKSRQHVDACAIDCPARLSCRKHVAQDIIVSGGQSHAFSDHSALASPKDLVMQAGRPLFIAPDNVSWLDLRSVLMAWKDTPEARRAIAYSLPMLRKAKEVTITEIVEAGGQPAGGGCRGPGMLLTWLSRHGVSASEVRAGAEAET